MKTIEELRSMPENEWITGVKDFHREKLPFSIHPDRPTFASAEDSLTEIGSNLQEFVEMVEAIATHDMVKLADGIGDTIYTLIGLALKFGIDLNAVFADIQRSNMDKNPAVPGTMGRKTATGGSMKPWDWVPPRIVEILTHQQKEAGPFF